MRAETGNAILDALPDAERLAIGKDLRPASFTHGETLCGRDEPVARVVFPRTCVLSTIKDMRDGSAVEICSIGHEGTSGISLAMGADDTAASMVCYIQGAGFVMEASAFLQHLAQLPAFNGAVQRFSLAAYRTVAQIAACNRFHSIEERCARWLLSSRDRAGRNTYAMTHEGLATLLGANRPSVTLVFRALQAAGHIRYRRGQVTILDGEGLGRVSCECYGVVAALLKEADPAA